MNEKNITSMSLEEAILLRSEEKTDWERLQREEDAGIEPEMAPDEGEFDWSQAKLVVPSRKTAISMRIDNDILNFFRSQGRGYQTRINAVLRSYVNATQGNGEQA